MEKSGGLVKRVWRVREVMAAARGCGKCRMTPKPLIPGVRKCRDRRVHGMMGLNTFPPLGLPSKAMQAALASMTAMKKAIFKTLSSNHAVAGLQHG
jgi:hypothetical protein